MGELRPLFFNLHSNITVSSRHRLRYFTLLSCWLGILSLSWASSTNQIGDVHFRSTIAFQSGLSHNHHLVRLNPECFWHGDRFGMKRDNNIRNDSLVLFGRRGNGKKDGKGKNRGSAASKSNLPEKICVVCGRPFTWRKKWERCWDEVTCCSKKCNALRRSGNSP